MRILTDAEVRVAMPTYGEAIDLMRQGLIALAEQDVDVRPKQGVSTRAGMFADAMPAALPDRNLLGLKWISVVPDNVERELPTASGVVVLNDGTTGHPTHLMPAAALTAMRTAAVSGACLQALSAPGPVAVIGSGVQAESHLRALAASGRNEIRLWARRGEQAEHLRDRMRRDLPQLRIDVHESKRAAIADAATVITVLAIGLTDTAIPAQWLRADALLLPIDYASSIGADLAASSAFATDDLDQFAVIRDVRRKLGDYPTPTVWTGNAIQATRPPGRMVIQNLGSAVNDVLLADEVRRRADERNLGTVVDL